MKHVTFTPLELKLGVLVIVLGVSLAWCMAGAYRLSTAVDTWHILYTNTVYTTTHQILDHEK